MYDFDSDYDSDFDSDFDGDFATAGPAVAQWHGFGRDQWPPLQCLRNYGPAFDPGFADLIDTALDA